MTAVHVRSAVPVGRDVPVWFLLLTAEYREGVAAFQARRPPNFNA